MMEWGVPLNSLSQDLFEISKKYFFFEYCVFIGSYRIFQFWVLHKIQTHIIFYIEKIKNMNTLDSKIKTKKDLHEYMSM
jgi:hypothetical protein